MSLRAGTCALAAALCLSGCYSSLPKHSNDICHHHGGVRSVDYQGGVVVCGDGKARQL
jgi:hypothetical protein